MYTHESCTYTLHCVDSWPVSAIRCNTETCVYECPEQDDSKITENKFCGELSMECTQI